MRLLSQRQGPNVGSLSFSSSTTRNPRVPLVMRTSSSATSAGETAWARGGRRRRREAPPLLFRLPLFSVEEKETRPPTEWKGLTRHCCDAPLPSSGRSFLNGARYFKGWGGAEQQKCLLKLPAPLLAGVLSSIFAKKPLVVVSPSDCPNNRYGVLK